MTRILSDMACTMCGCVCDDIEIHVKDERIVAAERACCLGEPWFLDPTPQISPAAAIGGDAVSLSFAMERAAELLTACRAPLVYGLSCSSTAGQRAAVRLADQLGGTVDTTASTCHAPSVMAVQSVGESTATLGEVRNRADVVVYWGSNPMKSHPRHVERCVEAPGLFVPEGRAGRHLVVVDTKQTETAEMADRFIRLDEGSDFDMIWALRSSLKSLPLECDGIGGVPRDQLISLANCLRAARYGAIFFGLGLTRCGVPHANVEALLALVTDLNACTRCIVRRMRIPGDVAGADSVLCWQTGFPFSVNLSRQYPRYNPGEYTANVLLARKEVDAIVLVGTEGVSELSSAAREHLASIPSVVLRSPGAEQLESAAVSFTTAKYGIHRAGTAYRMDEVPIPLRRAVASSLPSDDEVLTGIGQRLPATGAAARNSR